MKEAYGGVADSATAEAAREIDGQHVVSVTFVSANGESEYRQSASLTPEDAYQLASALQLAATQAVAADQ